MRRQFPSLFNLGNIEALLFLLLCYLGYTFYLEMWIIDDNFFLHNLEKHLTHDQAIKILNERRKYHGLGYVLRAFFVLIKLSVVALILYTGLVLSDIKVYFRDAFRVALFAEFVSVIPLLLTLIWFSLVQTDYSMEDVQYFYPLSLLNFFDPAHVNKIWLYPLQVINIFELAYLFVLAKFIAKITNSDFDDSLSVVVKSYIPALFMWIALIMFVMVTLMPSKA